MKVVTERVKSVEVSGAFKERKEIPGWGFRQDLHQRHQRQALQVVLKSLGLFLRAVGSRGTVYVGF